VAADEPGFARQPDALGVGAALGFATELFQENAIFFLEVFDYSRLVSAHPAGDRDEQKLELRRHRVENLSKVLVAQSSIWSRLSFLAVQVLSSSFYLVPKLAMTIGGGGDARTFKLPRIFGCILRRSRLSATVVSLF